jgi:hypothetical protein
MSAGQVIVGSILSNIYIDPLTIEYSDGSIGRNGKTVEALLVNSSVPGTKVTGMVIPAGELISNSIVNKIPSGRETS